MDGQSGSVATSNALMMFSVQLIYGERPTTGPDIIPLVHASHELSEVAVIADPNGSLAEREAIVKQTNTDARARDCRTFSTYTTETCKML